MSNSEFINQARKMLTEDYKARHTAEYNTWLNGHKNSWMQPHVIVPFPPFVMSAAMAPFDPTASSPSEDDVVAKALELYNQFNSASAPLRSSDPEPEVTLNQPVDVPLETVVQYTVADIPEVVAEVPAELPEPEVAEAEAVKVSSFTEEIYKIYQAAPAETSELDSTDPAFMSMEKALNVIPQPSEELAKVSTPGRILPNVLEKLQAMTAKWSTKGEHDV